MNLGSIDCNSQQRKTGRANAQENVRTNNQELHGHNHNDRTAKRTPQRLRRYLLHPQQIQLSSQLRHSLLAALLPSKEMVSLKAYGTKEKESTNSPKKAKK